MRNKYTRGGKAHHLLDRLTTGPARFGELVAVLFPVDPSRRDRRKARFVLEALLMDGMVCPDDQAWEITDAGRQLADRLGPISHAPGTSVRIFSEARP